MSMTQPMTREEFLAREERQEYKWEFDGVRATAFAGVTVAHATIQTNLIAELGFRLRGSGCKGYGSDLKLATAPGYRYPDAHVTREALACKARVSGQPLAIFEITSENTARLDRTIKLREYVTLPSVHYYVMLEPDAAAATVLTRTGTGWAIEVLDEAGVIDLPLIKIELPLAGLYEGVAFEPAMESTP